MRSSRRTTSPARRRLFGIRRQKPDTGQYEISIDEVMADLMGKGDVRNWHLL
ncbi:MAG TPA: hypothetical protein VFZ80_07285 [Acidimicrobiia bacterium]